MLLQELLENIQKTFFFLFEKEMFTVAYTFERRYPPHIRIGLSSSKNLHIKILFVHEWATSVLISTTDANFEDDTGWFDAGRIIDFILKRPLRWKQNKLNIPYKQFLLSNLEESAKELKEHILSISSIFANKDNFEIWEINFKKYVKIEIKTKFKKG